MEAEAKRRKAGPEPRHCPPEGTPAEALFAEFRRWGGSQAALAKAMGVSPSVVSRMFSGAADPHWSTIESFAKALGKRPRLELVS